MGILPKYFKDSRASATSDESAHTESLARPSLPYLSAPRKIDITEGLQYYLQAFIGCLFSLLLKKLLFLAKDSPLSCFSMQYDKI